MRTYFILLNTFIFAFTLLFFNAGGNVKASEVETEAVIKHLPEEIHVGDRVVWIWSDSVSDQENGVYIVDYEFEGNQEVFDEAGVYEVSLKVVDSNGTVAETKKEVEVFESESNLSNGEVFQEDVEENTLSFSASFDAMSDFEKISVVSYFIMIALLVSLLVYHFFE